MHIPLSLQKVAPLIDSKNNVIFFDSARSADKKSQSCLFLDPETLVIAHDYEEVKPLLHRVDACADTCWVAGYLSYEAAYALENRFSGYCDKKPVEHPLGWFGVYTQPYIFDHTTGSWDREPPACADEYVFPVNAAKTKSLAPTLTQREFERKIRRIKTAIEQGTTYQVNFTYDVLVEAGLTPFEFYAQLRVNQLTSYCAFVKNDYGCIASFSPELFFARHNNEISVKPMKGTARRGGSAAEDEAVRSSLYQDEKNRAENLMIVDLLRNDLGRICVPGSIQTTDLFTIETHPTVHQMTSTIRGTLTPETLFSDIITSIFPCGSVTGAPKISAMEMIRTLESGCRGVYCGALGYVSPAGDACFSVPIRTLQKGAAGRSSWRYRVGSGIVWDSCAEDEWQECDEKCRFLTMEMPRFECLESLLFDKGLVLCGDHCGRMAASAGYFNYPFSRSLSDREKG